MFHPFAPATPRQKQALRDMFPAACPDMVEALTHAQAHRLIAGHLDRWRSQPPTVRQQQVLRTWGQWQPGLTRGEASDRIAQIKARAATLTPEEINDAQVLAQRRQAGFEW